MHVGEVTGCQRSNPRLPSHGELYGDVKVSVQLIDDSNQPPEESRTSMHVPILDSNRDSNRRAHRRRQSHYRLSPSLNVVAWIP